MYDVVNNSKPDLLIRASMVNSNLLFPQVNLRNLSEEAELTEKETCCMIRNIKKEREKA